MLLRLLSVLLFAHSFAAGGQQTFSGRVSHGQNFSYRLAGGLWFCLYPEPDANGGGWRIAVAEKCNVASHDFVSVATPPFHGVNPIEIEAWHFDAGANAPQTERDFAFVLNDRDWARLGSDLNSYQDAGKMLKELDDLGRGHGTLTITRMVRHASAEGKSLFDWMQFRVVISIPNK
jgi:hypothetical protein